MKFRPQLKNFINYKVFFYTALIVIVMLLSKEFDFKKQYLHKIKSTFREIAVQLNIKEPIIVEDTSMRIYYLDEKGISSLEESSLVSESISSPSIPDLHENLLIKLNQPYKYQGKTYIFPKEGLYRILDFQNNASFQVIVYQKDAHKLLSALSWIIAHGNKDSSLSIKEQYDLSHYRSLSMTCGDISKFAQYVLEQAGIKSRIIYFSSLNKQNTYDNGHILLEVQINGHWQIVDIDNNAILNINNQPTNALDIAQLKDKRLLQIVKIAHDSNLDRIDNMENGINFSFYTQYIFSNELEWYTRVLQVVTIENNNQFFYPDIYENKPRIKKVYPYFKPLSLQQFQNLFYHDK